MPEKTEQTANTAVTVATPGGGAPGGDATIVSGRYELLSLLGSGGCGTVHKAFDRRLEELVALKFLHDAGEAAVGHLLQEVKLSRRVSHRNVVRVFDIGEDAAQTFLTMEFVEGESLGARIARTGPMPRMVFLHLARQIAAGVAAAHFAGVAHRDLKPANVLLRWDEAKVTDFGIARAYATGRDFSGTPEYMAPEQIESAQGSARSDVYSLGVLFFEMLTGARPFRERNLARAYAERLERGALDVTALCPDVDEAIAALVRACTEPDPSARPASGAEVRDALNAVPFSGKSSGVPAAMGTSGEGAAEVERRIRNDAGSGFRYGWIAAAERMEQALLGDPENPIFLSWLATALAHGFSVDWLAEEKFVERARDAAGRAKTLAPDAAAPYVAAGTLARALGDHEGGAREFSSALARDRASPDANHAMGELLVSCGDFDGGVSHLRSALEADPSQEAFAWSLARAYAMEGDMESFELHATPPRGSAELSTYWATRIETISFMAPDRLRRDLELVRAEEFDLKPPVLATLSVFLDLGEQEPMLAILREIGSAGSPLALRRRDRMRRFLTEICGRLGRADAALDALEDCDSAATIELPWLRRSPTLAALRHDRRYAGVLARTAARAEGVLHAARRAPA